MNSTDGLVFKLASSDEELEQIRALTYETFVEEIPQHPQREDRRLKDKFDEENTYVICLDRDRLAGMVALRGRRPFSLDGKVEGLDRYLPSHRSPCELRILSVRREYRKQRVAARLLALTADVCERRGHDLALISGTTRELKLYGHLGFVPFGPLVGTPGALFQPMYLTLNRYREGLKEVLRRASPDLDRDRVNLLTGPVEIEPWVREAFGAEPLSHRSGEFKALMRATQGMLCGLTGAHQVLIAPGSGTLANDMIAAQLAARGERGLILSNGEFGDRLLDHAARFGLRHDALRVPWGEPFDEQAVEDRLGRAGDIAWLWFVHGETSTGVLNDLTRVQGICHDRGVLVCLDAVSTVGAVPLDLGGVHLASCSSGKALRAYSGLALVFHRELVPGRGTPRYLDLDHYRAAEGVPFTIGSNLVNALRASVERLEVPRAAAQAAEATGWLRQELQSMGLPAVAPPDRAHPAVLTIPLPPSASSIDVGGRLARSGFMVGYESRYLVERNWIQVCLMREVSVALVEPLPRVLGEIVAES